MTHFNDQYPSMEEIIAEADRQRSYEAEKRAKRIEQLLIEQNKLLREQQNDQDN